MQDIADMTSFIIAILSLGVPEEYEVDWLTKGKFIFIVTYQTNICLIKVGLAVTVSCLKSIPSKALSCVLSTPSPMPNKAAMISGYRVPSTPLVTL